MFSMWIILFGLPFISGIQMLISMISGTLYIQQNIQYMRKINSVEKNSDQKQNINERETK